ncbi:E1 ubiquitin-activating protein [Saccharomycopsis crataegensis]|uniref:Ubiquitin-activating enzyme E1-like n=1 Tax=Saccharomycopsis crataegensis TaxID=43959 RepID=A0AAV5QPD6_9ASCO|nr:E1 ubiquitin-activating protein [Saccharomycopsis crataegensis]
MGKDSQLQAVLGKDVLTKVRAAKVLLVGAGGIGCELLKDLVLMGYGEIHVVDLDTIDLSNLNRQFLFRHKDIKKPKASTAVAAVETFNFHNSKLVSYMANIMDTKQFPLSWFDQFNFIFNALDNIAARSYVNKMCLFLKKPSIESGTTGFNGQVTPIFPYQTECYECTVKETPKTYPVCTIRSTPSQPVHCVTWAKNYLFGQLFGEDEETSPTDFGTDNQDEIKNMVSEQNELKELKNLATKDDFFESVIDKIFIKDINKLLALEELWKTRKRPIPLAWDSSVKDKIEAITDSDVARGQDVWPIEKYIFLLMRSIKELQQRLADGETDLEFDKDDEVTLDFVVAATNIRSHMFHIPLKSKFDIKQIAGNIIPAIATTNSIISGFSALASLQMFTPNPREGAKMVYTFQDATRFVSTSSVVESNRKCKSCSIPRGVLKINLSHPEIVLGDVVDALVKGFKYGHDEIALILGKDRLIYDVDFDDNKDKKLADIGFQAGEVLLVNDENDEKATVELYIEAMDSGKIEVPNMELPDAPEKEATEEQEDEKEDDDVLQAISDDAPIIIDEEEEAEEASKKHKLDEIDEHETTTSKKQKTSEGQDHVLIE